MERPKRVQRSENKEMSLGFEYSSVRGEGRSPTDGSRKLRETCGGR